MKFYSILKKKSVIGFLFLTTFLASSCSNGVKESDLVGTWQHIMFEYVLNKDGTYQVDLGFDHGGGNWHMESDSLFIGSDTYRVDSMTVIEEHGKKYDALYLSYSRKKFDLPVARHWFNFEEAYDSFLERVEEGYLATKEGYQWLISQQGKEWQASEDGKKWLASEEGKTFMADLEALEIVQAKWIRERQ